MRANIDILSRAWQQLQSRWLVAIALTLLHSLISFVVGTVGMGLGSLVLSGALTFGFNRTMVQIYRGQTPKFETYFDGFQHFLQALILFLLTTTICMVGFVLLFIPGLIAVVGLSQAFYVLQDRPELGAIEALKESWRLVWSQGHFWKVVGLGLLSLFVILLGALAFGVGLLFAIPLVSVAGAGLYDELKGPSFDADGVDFV